MLKCIEKIFIIMECLAAIGIVSLVGGAIYGICKLVMWLI